MEQYMTKTRTDYGSGIARPKIEDNDSFELKGQFLKELRDNTFSGSDHEDANEHIEKVLEIVDLFHIPNITIDQITTWEYLKTKLLSKYCPPARTAKKWKEIKKLSARDEYSQKWHNGTSRTRSTETYDGLAALQAQLNNLGREIKKVNEKVYAAQVGCEQCKGPHYTKDFPLKEEGKTLEEAYYTQFSAPFQGGIREICEVIENFRARNDASKYCKVFGYPSDCGYDKKIRIDCAYNLKFSCMIDFTVLEDMNAYRDERMGDDLAKRKETDNVGGESTIWKSGSVGVLKSQDVWIVDYHLAQVNVKQLDVPTRQILDSRGAIPSKTAADAKVAIQEMVEYSQKWHDGTSRTRNTKTSDGLAAIQAQLNNLGREIKKVNENFHAAQVGCEQCKGPHYTKDYPLKEEGKTLKEAYYT
ncbi:hypothetical protein Tco_0810722 [Tanacetum coccineum]